MIIGVTFLCSDYLNWINTALHSFPRLLQNWHLWHISYVCVARNRSLTTCYVFDFCATTPRTVLTSTSFAGVSFRQTETFAKLASLCTFRTFELFFNDKPFYLLCLRLLCYYNFEICSHLLILQRFQTSKLLQCLL